MNMNQKSVILRAPLLTSSGYGVHSRQIYRWLRTKNVQLQTQPLNWGLCSWIVDRNMYDGMVGEIMDKTLPGPLPADVSIQVQLPNEWDTKIARFNVGVTAAVESDRCNPEWVTACNKMNHVIVPSIHIEQVLRNSGIITTPISVVPEAFYDEVISGYDKSTAEMEFDTSFNFLVVGQFTGNNPLNDRKNLFFTIKWLCEAFANDPTVGIVLKLNSGRGSKIDRDLTRGTIQKIAQEVRTGLNPRIHVLHGAMTNSEIAGLYHNPSIKAMVSLTRGEGYGLPLLEAAAAGLPVIATNWSGHLDFLNQGRFVKIDYDLAPIHASRVDNKVFISGSKWAEAREDDFKRKVQKFRQKSDVPQEWARELSSKIIAKYSQNAINTEYDRVLGNCL